MTIQTLLINEISIDPNLQSRVSINKNVVDDYAEAIQSTDTLPPLTVFHDGICYFLADGFHRLQAHKNLGRDRVSVKVIDGGRRDAFLFALSANAEHGLRRSHADKRRAAQMALEDPELGQCSNREIAKLCKVSHSFVNATRESLKPKPVIKPSVAQTNWPKHEPRVETFPHDLSDEDILQEPYTELDEVRDINKSLAEELERANDRVAIAALDATEEEKQLYAKTLEELRAENSTLTVVNHSITISRDDQTNKNSELIRQCSYLEKKIKRLNQQITKLHDELNFYRSVGGAPSENIVPATHPTGTPAS
jgi:ParB-like nuclease domain